MQNGLINERPLVFPGLAPCSICGRYEKMLELQVMSLEGMRCFWYLIVCAEHGERWHSRLISNEQSELRDSLEELQ